MDDFTSGLIKDFNFKPKYIKKLKYMYICYTDKGTKLIKPINNSFENIMFIHKIKQHLKNQGFNRVDFYNLSKEGLPYVVNQDITYVMTDYLDFDEMSFSKESDILHSVESIAMFHKLCQGSQRFLNNDDIMFFNILKEFSKKVEILKKIRKIVAKQKNLSDFDVCFIKNYDYFYENAVTSLEILEKYNYEKINITAERNNMICHNNLKEESLLLNKGSVFISNMENITIDHFVLDLAKFLIRLIRKHEDNTITLEAILKAYSKINYIDYNIAPILYGILRFPERYIDTCQKFYDKKRNFIPISISSQLDNIISLKSYHQNFISSIKPK